MIHMTARAALIEDEARHHQTTGEIEPKPISPPLIARYTIFWETYTRAIRVVLYVDCFANMRGSLVHLDKP